jgi:protein-L-isoaspartate O-methyltransferase
MTSRRRACVHVGAWTGYHTAITAHLVSPSGKVTAIEFDPSLAARAGDNFASSNNLCPFGFEILEIEVTRAAWKH